MIYLVIILSFLVLSYIYDYRGKEKNRLLWWIIMLIVLICVSGFRYQMGQDSIRYEKYYEDCPPIDRLSWKNFQNTRFAPLYIILSSICKTLTSEFMLLQFIEAIVVNSVFCWFIWKHTKHIFFGGLLYFIFLFIVLNMQVLREAFAVSVFLISWPYFESRKWLQYYLFCVVAFFFHVSALVLFLLPLVFVPGIRELFVFGKRTIIILLILLVVSFLIQLYLFDFVQLIALTETMAERASVYSKDELGGNRLNIMGAVGLLGRYVVYPLIAMYFLRKARGNKVRKAAEVPAFERVTLVGLYAVSMSVGVMILSRYVNYFEIFALIMIADWVFTKIYINKRLIILNYVYWLMLLTPLFAVQFYVEYWMKLNKSGTIRYMDMFWPYSNQFDKDISPNRKKAIEYTRKY